MNHSLWTDPIPHRPCYRLVKRLLDVLIAGLALLLLLPLFLPVMLLLRLTGEGEIFYLQERLGYRKRTFRLIKFATMLKNSPHIGTGTITTQNDPRVLPLGCFLRKTKINELPQFLNVLNGDMTMVGPRPQTPECFAFFPETDREHIFGLKPGLTGIGSVVFRDEEAILGASPKGYDQCYREEIMPYKLALELWYLRHQSLWVDLKIIALTAIAIAFPNNTLHFKWLKDLPSFHAP